jgi:hypothetical protein
MRLLFILFFLIATLILKSQNIFPVKFTGCVTDKFLLEDKIRTTTNKDSLLRSIVSNLDPNILAELRGKMYIQIIIDSLGTPCCMSVQNDLNSSIGRLNIDQIINNKTKWSPPVQDGEKIKVAAIILLAFSKKEISFKRLGFNGKTGWKDLETCFIAKKEILSNH